MIRAFLPGIVLLAFGETAAQSAVTLQEQRAELHAAEQGGTFELRFVVTNHLSVAVEDIEIGLLFADSTDDLESVDPALAYSGKAAGLGMRRLHLPTEVGAGEHQEHVESLSHPEKTEPAPRAFRTHVLGFRLKEPRLTVLNELLLSGDPAAEVAAIRTVALDGTDEQKSTVRQALAQDSALRTELAEVLREPIVDRPTDEQMFSRVYAVRAAGVLGGEELTGALETMLASPRLSRFDEPLRLLRVARLSATRLEAALAYAVPIHARRMHDVVSMALRDATGLSNEDGADEQARTGDDTRIEGHPPQTASVGREANTDSKEDRLWGSGVVVGGLVVGAGLLWRIRKGAKSR